MTPSPSTKSLTAQAVAGVVPPTDGLQAYTGEEVMVRLRIARRTLSRLVASGELRTLRPAKPGQRIYVSAAALRAYLDREVA